MPIQTTVNFTHDQLLKGMRAKGTPDECYTAYSTNNIPFGVALVLTGLDSDGKVFNVDLPSATGQKFVGISKFNHKEQTYSNDGLGVLTSTADTFYEAGYPITAVKKGAYKVEVVDAVGPTTEVHFYHTGANTGNFGGASNASADQLTVGCTWLTSTTGAGFAILEINITGINT